MPRPKAIPEWKRSWRWLSMQIGAGALLFGNLPTEQQLAILGWFDLRMDQLPAVLGAAFMVGRLLQQENK